MVPARKLTLVQILADPKNQKVSTRFIKFAFLMILLPLGFLLLSMRLGLFSVEVSGVVSVILVNVTMGFYAFGAYSEEEDNTRQKVSPKVD